MKGSQEEAQRALLTAVIMRADRARLCSALLVVALLHLLVSQQVPNDCALGREGARDDAAMEGEAGEAGEAGPPPPERLLLLTGPNASGKTVYLRTMALITYLAHVGSFVPAAAARIGLTDAISTRMQSRESAAIKASAFMIDLRQMATMLGGATPRTLCLIDEFGKGTNAQDRSK